ncbi:uncharacterized protein [Montipora foliosa]|uniref:uncharacterized protein isoform X1 n=1 Tax=Montipora foliosa TaxID=591990 RepID=UPI0035F15FD0
MGSTWRTRVPIVGYCFFGVITTFVNKHVLSNLHFTYPTVFQSWQTGSSALALLSMSTLGFTDLNIVSVNSELKQQIQNLAEVVKQLTSLKYIHQHEPKISPSPALFDDQLSDPALSAVIENVCNQLLGYPSLNAASANPIESPVQPTHNQNHKELSPVCLPLLAPTRQPLLSIDRNVPLHPSMQSWSDQ